MAQLVDVLYPVPDYRRTPGSLLRWWESRRLLYNGLVGAAGVITLGGVALFSWLPPHPLELEFPLLLLSVLAYGLLANACFTLGWMVEMVAQVVWGRDAPDLGPLLFREGLIFSVGLTLFPLMLAALFWVLRVVLVLVSRARQG